MRMTTVEFSRIVGGTHLGPERTVEHLVLERPAIGGRPGELYVGARYLFEGLDTNPGCAGAFAATVPYLTERPPLGGTSITVGDTQAACRRLVSVLRQRLTPRVIGISGSVGKTTARALIGAAMGTTYSTVMTPRSFNTDIGLAATLMEADPTTECVVLELGARYRGDIARLTEVVRPTVGVLLPVGHAHAPTIGGERAIAETKAALVTTLPYHGTAVVPADPGPLVSVHLADCVAPRLTYGAGGDVSAESVAIDAELRLEVDVATPWGTARVRPPCRARHNVTNVLAAVAAAAAVGIRPEVAAAGIETAVLEPHRMVVHRRPDGLVVIDDTYNSTALALRSAFDALLEVPAAERIAVIGTLEGHPAIDSPFDPIFAAARAAGIRLIGYRNDDVDPQRVDHAAAVAALASRSPNTTAILVKGSRKAALEHVVDRLLENPAEQPASG